MRIEARSGQEEAHILTGIIISTPVLARIAAKWDSTDGGPFASRYANLVAHWAVKYHRQYNAAPGPAIQGLYGQWAATPAADKDTAALVERFLAGLSESYAADGTLTPDYLIDMAGRHFNRVRAQRAITAAQAMLDGNDVDGAWGALNAAGRLEMGVGAGVDILLDTDAAAAAWAEDQQPLFTYPGALGRFFSNAFTRDSFVSLVASTGRGKTWWMCDFALQAARARKRTAFFVVGDMSLAQIERRFQIRCARQSNNSRPYNYPTALTRGKEEYFATVAHDRRTDEPLSARAGIEAFKRVQQKDIKSRESYLKVSVHPSLSITSEGLGGVIAGWQLAGWVPDVVVVDYPDNLGPPPGVKDKREQINVTWQQLKGLSQTLHACVIVATQSDAAGYDKITLRKGNFSEARFKNDHVSAIMALNQTDEEKRAGVYRLNWTKFREAEYDEARCVHVASCLAIGNPAVLSCL